MPGDCELEITAVAQGYQAKCTQHEYLSPVYASHALANRAGKSHETATRRWQRDQQPKPQCNVDDCAAEVHARGWCFKHYKRWLKHEDPLATLTIRGSTAPSYDTVHIRVAVANGNAKDYFCVACGAPAQHWACYRNKTNEGHTRGHRASYSMAIEDYAPLCVRCNVWSGYVHKTQQGEK